MMISRRVSVLIVLRHNVEVGATSPTSLFLQKNSKKTKNAPLQKAIELVEGLKTTAEEDMQAERVMYAKYEQWVSGETSRLNSEIEKLGVSSNTSAAAAEKLKADALALDESVNSNNGTLYATFEEGGVFAEKEKMEEENSKLRAEYERAYEDYQSAIYMLEKATAHLKSKEKYNAKLRETTFSKEGRSLLQQAKRKLLPLQERLSALQMFIKHSLNNMKGDEVEDTGDVMETMRALRDSFLAEMNTMVEVEHERKLAYTRTHSAVEMLIQKLENQIDEEKKYSSQKKAKSAELEATSIEDAQTKDDLSATLAEMTATSEQKATQFRGRQEARKAEINALSQAIEVLTGGMKKPAEAGAAAAGTATAGLITKKTKSSKKTSFLQLASYAIRSLKSESSQAKSLSAQRARVDEARYFLAEHVGDSPIYGPKIASIVSLLEKMTGPFDKVITMVQDLITRLEKEAAEEATHHAWCEKEVGTTKENIEAASASVREHAATINSLNGEGEVLKNQKIPAASEMLNATKAELVSLIDLHNQESALRKKEITETTLAVSAVGDALAVLTQFYDVELNANIPATGFVQLRSRSKQQPEIFDDAPYAGGGASGILDFLGFIKTGFEEELRKQQETDAEAETEYRTTKSDTELEIEKLTATLSELNAKHAQKVGKLEDEKLLLGEAEKQLEEAEKYMEELTPSCIAPINMEDRVAEREKTIASLREALTILHNY